MNTKLKILIPIALFLLSVVPINYVKAGNNIAGNTFLTLPDTDAPDSGMLQSLFYVFDLRDRETYIQLTYPDLELTGFTARSHIQIYDVSNNCNENNFFDDYTPNDTHIYNLRDIQTNDGNPSGAVLPEGSYGIVVITMYTILGNEPIGPSNPIGNLRIIDNNGYEYRTNAQNIVTEEIVDEEFISSVFYSFNYNQQAGVSLSDVFGITLYLTPFEPLIFEWIALPVQGIFSSFDIDIYDLNEVPFSCRDVIFSCVDQDNPLLEEVLAIAGTANVASFEYGINDAIPHSKGGELLCPSNTVGEGSVILRPEAYPDTDAFRDIFENIDVQGPYFFGYIGLNNGNGRGSMDSFWVFNFTLFEENME